MLEFKTIEDMKKECSCCGSTIYDYYIELPQDEGVDPYLLCKYCCEEATGLIGIHKKNKEFSDWDCRD